MTPTRRSGTPSSGVGVAGVESEDGGWRMEDGAGGSGARMEDDAKPIFSADCSGFAGNIARRWGVDGVKIGNSIGSGVFSTPGNVITGGGGAIGCWMLDVGR